MPLIQDRISRKLLSYYKDNSKLIDSWRENYSRLYFDIIRKTIGLTELAGQDAFEALELSTSAVMKVFSFNVTRDHASNWRMRNLTAPLSSLAKGLSQSV